jgi:hypothetical protein
MTKMDRRQMNKFFFIYTGSISFIIALILSFGVFSLFTQKMLTFQNNWLINIFKINCSLFQSDISILHIRNYLDIEIMIIFSLFLFGLANITITNSRILILVAILITVLGIIVFLITNTAGRSSVLISIILVSIAIIMNNNYGFFIGLIGIAAGALLFIGGDILTSTFPQSNMIAIFTGIGYISFILWQILIGIASYRFGFK